MTKQSKARAQGAHLFRAVLFDFDYTLADSSAGIIECTNYALEALGLPTASAEDIRSTIGLSLTEMLVRLWGEVQRPLGAEFHRLFVERADQVMASRTVLYPFVPGMAIALREHGLPAGILSTKYRYRIEAVLRREGLAGAFAPIVGGEDVARHKPDPEGLLMALALLGQPSPEQVVYVGDSPADAEAAQHAGVPFAAVLSGVTPAHAFEPYGPWAILRDASELLPRLFC